MNRRRNVLSTVQIFVPLGIMSWLIYSIGTAPFVAAFRSLSPISVVAALSIGTLAILVQAQRWRLVSRRFKIDHGKSEAIAKRWQAAFLNSMLPGGLVWDTIRAVEQRIEPEGTWRGSVGSVVSERFTGTMVTLVAAAIALFLGCLGSA